MRNRTSRPFTHRRSANTERFGKSLAPLIVELQGRSQAGTDWYKGNLL
jgi:hypothetical protein